MSRFNSLPAVSRRQFVIGGGVTLGLGALAACSDGAGGGGGSKSPSALTSSTAKAKPGGTLRFGYSLGSAADQLDAQFAIGEFSVAAGVQLASGLMIGTSTPQPDGGFLDGSAPRLAEEVTLENPTSVLVRLRPDIEFHNGRSITSEDVMASFARILDPRSPGAAASSLAQIDLQSSRILDERTVRFKLSSPNAFIVGAFANNLAVIHPDGKFDPKNGSGPFKDKSVTPGDSVEFVRFENYFEPVMLDGLIIQNFADDTGKLNALRSGAVDMVGEVPPHLAETIGSEFQVYSSRTGGFPALVMDAKSDLFKDARVRQAFRLIVDRPALMEQVMGGTGTVANDLSSPFDPAYIGDELPQRSQDIDEAKALLKAAGAEGLTIEMATAGQVPNLEVAFAQQAKAAGVTIKVKQVDSTTYFSQHYGQDPFFGTMWPSTPIDTQFALAIGPNAFYPEGNWDNPDFLPLWDATVSDMDDESRNEKLAEIQRMFHEDGTHIIFAFSDQFDAASNRVGGVTQDSSGYPVGFFDFNQVGFV
jgi:peptide/nickel transport system substrate-binding protein